MKRLLILFVLLLCIVPFVSAEAVLIGSPSSCTWNHTANDHDADGEKIGSSGAGGMCDGDIGTYAGWNWTGYIDATYPTDTVIDFCQYYTSGPQNNLWIYNLTSSALMENGYAPQNAWYNATFISLNQPHSPRMMVRFANGIANEFKCYGTPAAPIADFTGAPLAGVAPLNVAFTDTSQNKVGECTYNWSITPVENVTGNVGALENHTAVFNDIGLYNVSHGVSCPAGSNISTKTNYINVTNQTAYVTTAFRATDGATGNRITGATIHLNDVENGSWSNSSTNLGVATITVLQGHHISAYATALGFSDGEYLNAPAMAWTYDIMMLPTGFANVSAGNVTAYITVTDADTLQKLYGAQVNALYATGEGSFILESQTNSAGVASFVLPNNTNVHFTGVKSGYESSQLVLNTGTGSGGDAHVEGELKMSKLTVTPTITQTTLPGGGTPAPTQTYLRYCNPDAADYNEDACRTSENTGMMDQLREAGPSIIGLCIVAILMGLLKIIMG